MVSVQVKKSTIRGTIRCPSSKSYSHRAIVIASLCEGQSTITNALLARDTLATLAACNTLGANIQRGNTTLWVEGKHSFDPPDNVVNAENSGTTIRIVTAMSALVEKGFTVLTGDESLRKRPMQPIIDALNQLGVRCYSAKMDGTPPLIVRGGGIKGGITVVDGSVSSQFVSALLITCIYADSTVLMRINGEQVSKTYIETTLATMKAFGVTVDYEPNFLEYHIENKEYRATTFDVPSDFSTLALILAAGVLTGDELTVRGLNFSLPHGDLRIIDIIRIMGGNVRVDKQKGVVIVYGSSTLEGGDFDLTDTPDLLPVVSILALKSRSPVKISGIAHARLKETDRVANIASELMKLGAITKEEKNELSIISSKSFEKCFT